MNIEPTDIPTTNSRVLLYSEVLNDKLNTKTTNLKDQNTVIKNKPRKYELIGTNNKCCIKATTKKQIRRLFVSRLNPDTISDDIAEHLTKSDIQYLSINKLKAKFPQYYSSFMIEAEKIHFEKLFSTTLWPTGALIKSFYLPKYKKSNTIGYKDETTTSIIVDKIMDNNNVNNIPS